jgi:hypothetical protein
MQICIQDPAKYSTYLLQEDDLQRFAVDPADDGVAADVLFVHPAATLVQELPASRLTDSETPSVQIVDPDRSRSWLIGFEALQDFRVPTPPSEGNVVWFAMPSAKEILAAVPVFRRALVQHSS